MMIDGQTREAWPAEVKDGVVLCHRHLLQVAHWAGQGIGSAVRAGAMPWGFFLNGHVSSNEEEGDNVVTREANVLRLRNLAFLTHDGHVMECADRTVDLALVGYLNPHVDLEWNPDGDVMNYVWRLVPAPGDTPAEELKLEGGQRRRLLTLRGLNVPVVYEAPFVHAGAAGESRKRLRDLALALAEFEAKLDAVAESEAANDLPYERLRRAAHALLTPHSFYLSPAQLAERLDELGESVVRFANQFDWGRQPLKDRPASGEAQRRTARTGARPWPRLEKDEDDPFLKSGTAIVKALDAMLALLREADTRIALSDEIIGTRTDDEVPRGQIGQRYEAKGTKQIEIDVTVIKNYHFYREGEGEHDVDSRDYRKGKDANRRIYDLRGATAFLVTVEEGKPFPPVYPYPRRADRDHEPESAKLGAVEPRAAFENAIVEDEERRPSHVRSTEMPAETGVATPQSADAVEQSPEPKIVEDETKRELAGMRGDEGEVETAGTKPGAVEKKKGTKGKGPDAHAKGSAAGKKNTQGNPQSGKAKSSAAGKKSGQAKAHAAKVKPGAVGKKNAKAKPQGGKAKVSAAGKKVGQGKPPAAKAKPSARGGKPGVNQTKAGTAAKSRRQAPRGTGKRK